MLCGTRDAECTTQVRVVCTPRDALRQHGTGHTTHTHKCLFSSTSSFHRPPTLAGGFSAQLLSVQRCTVPRVWYVHASPRDS